MSLIRLALSSVLANFDNFNIRTEKAGDKDVPAADFKFEIAQPADILNVFSPDLKKTLFQEGTIDLANGLPLRYTDLVYPLKFDQEMTGAKLQIDVGVGDPMKFDDCKVGEFRLTPMEGGSVIMVLRVQCKPTAAQVGTLYELQKHKLTISIVPPELPVMQEATQ